MLKNISLMLTTVFLLGIACATAPPKNIEPEATIEKYKAICNSWIGKNIDKLVDLWGYPVKEFKAPNGNTVYAYHRRKTIPLSLVNISGELELYCITYFEVDQNRQIIKWHYEGNNCRSR